MRIFRIILFAIIFFSPLSLHGGPFVYRKGLNTFEVRESAREYQVICYQSSAYSSRNKNITDRQLRMDAIDLIGVYILYQQSDIAKNYGSDYFSIYAEGLNLHYNATLESLKQSEIMIDGRLAKSYNCDKGDYVITSTSYIANIDIASLLKAHYQKDKSEESASLLYNYGGFTSALYLELERDYLTGRVQLPSAIRLLQGVEDRLERSVISPEESKLLEVYGAAKGSTVNNNPFRQFFLVELVTSAPLNRKGQEYDEWVQSLNSKGCIYESILAFVARNRHQAIPKEDEATFTSVIEAFPGAVSPFGIRQPINHDIYNKAVKAYSNSDFEEASRLLTESIDNEGITPQSLNLIGASYRYLGKSEKALSYLLLAFLLQPNTDYLAGNIYLCLKAMGFKRLDEAKSLLMIFPNDSWSKSVMNDDNS